VIDIIHSAILETYIAPLQETTTQRHSQRVYRFKPTRNKCLTYIRAEHVQGCNL